MKTYKIYDNKRILFKTVKGGNMRVTSANTTEIYVCELFLKVVIAEESNEN